MPIDARPFVDAMFIRMVEIFQQHAPFLASEDERAALKAKWDEIAPGAVYAAQQIRSVRDEDHGSVVVEE